MNTFGKILVPTDFSEHAQAAFRAAHDLAKARGSSGEDSTDPVAKQPASRAKS